MTTPISPEDQLLAELASYATRPLDFVYWAFPWGEQGSELADRSGPEKWQRQVLSDLQAGLIGLDEAYRLAVRSGHGIGKSAFVSWLILWAVSTKVDTRGRVTANTEKQLRVTLWSELAKWHRLFIASCFFKYSATAIYSADSRHEKTWRVDAIPWSSENPEAFAGLHNYGKRILIIIDEASAVDDVIWEVLDGATTDANTEIIWAVTGNPTKNVGRFRDCFDKFTDAWRGYRVDSREVTLSNKKDIARWAQTWGEDSDFFRVRVRGEFPNASMLQLIPVESIRSAQNNEAQSQHWEPLILAVDIARFGNNENCAVWRRGRDARTMPCWRWQGLTIVETANRIAGLISKENPDATFVDEGGVGGGVVDVLRSLGHSVIPVNFGSVPSQRPGGTLVGNKRAEMYVALRDWLREGGSIEGSPDLYDQLVGIEYHFNKKSEIMLMSKEDMRSIGRPSPDWADALAMTFAFPVSARGWRRAGRGIAVEYDPYSEASWSASIAGTA